MPGRTALSGGGVENLRLERVHCPAGRMVFCTGSTSWGNRLGNPAGFVAAVRRGSVGIVAGGNWHVHLAGGISGYLGWIGQATCGCFGTIQASPWHAFAMDGTALAFLAIGFPKQVSSKTPQEGGLLRVVSSAAYFVLGVVAIVACLAGMGTWSYGSPAAALAHLRGEALAVKPEFVDCGTGKSGEILEAVVEVHNWSDRSVRVYGGTSDCSCIATKGLPVAIPPGESRLIPVILKVPTSAPGAFTRSAELFTDSDNQRTMRLHIGCHVE